jgi:AraC-like DNA-binding protein
MTLGTPPYHFNIFNSLILAGIVQGLIFGIVVSSSKKYRDTGTLILAVLIVAFSLSNLQYYLANTHLVKNRYLYGITWTPFQLAMAPLIYCYGLKLLHPEKRISNTRIAWLFMPFALGVIAVNYMKLRYNYLEDKATYLTLEAVMEFCSIFITATLVGRLIFKTRKTQREAKVFGVSKVLPKLQWFRNILITFFLLCFVWFYVTLQMVFDDAPQEIWYFIWISLSVMIYWLGHIGIYKYGVMEERKKIRNHTLSRSSIVVVDKNKSDYLTSFEDLLVNKKYFLNPDLTLDKVAEELNLSKSHLSRIINKEMGTSFPEYINELRVREAQFYLRHPDFGNYTLVAIGLEAGFASKTSFNNTFKKVTGMTPSEYKNSATDESQMASESLA